MLIIRGHRVVLPTGERPAAIHIDNGIIVDVREYDDIARGTEIIDAGLSVVLPGLVDSHVHVNEPGRTEWEGFDTATRAAAAGGVTTIVDMPLNSVPATVSAEALAAKRSAARDRCHVDVTFWGGVVPGNQDQIDGLVDAGVRGFKCFLVPSGVDEFPAVGEADLRRALPILARRDVPLLVHAESERYIADCRLQIDDCNRQSSIVNRQSYGSYLATRPPEAEVDAVRLMIALAEEFRVHVHIVHVAAVGAADEIARARARRAP